MQARIDLTKISPAAYTAMAGLEGFVRGSGLDPALLHLVRMRASQINGCAYCLDMHSKDARAEGGDRAAALRAQRVARDPVLQRA
jgi:AhpD family alkylhydroperoxidase